MEKILSSILLWVTLTATSTTALSETDKYGPEVLVAWNDLVLELAVAEDKLLTLKGLRTASIMHTAIHDALNSVEKKYNHYSFSDNKGVGNPVATSAQAAYTVLVSQYPDAQPALDTELSKWINPDNADHQNGMQLGESAAKHILALRENDAWNTEAEYTLHPMGPGVYAEFPEHSGTPQGFVFGPGWAKAKTWVLASADHIRSVPPPPINSGAYTVAFNEVKAAGAEKSIVRSEDQAHFAMWWKDFAENSHNRLARDIVSKQQMDLWSSARLFALLNISIYDGYISALENKFFYNHWRPVTAIRWAEKDGNPDTEQDSQWTNLHDHTYPYPSYPSAHATVCAAAMSIFGYVLGDRIPFAMETKKVNINSPFSDEIEMKPSVRQFESFSEAARECAESRVYLGIHFRYDSDEGNKLGNQIGSTVFANTLQPVTN